MKSIGEMHDRALLDYRMQELQTLKDSELLDDIEEMISKGNEPPVPWNRMAYLFFKHKRNESAKHACEKAIEKNLVNPILYHDYATVLFRLEYYEEALDALDKAEGKHVRETAHLRCQALVALKRLDEALQVAEAGLENASVKEYELLLGMKTHILREQGHDDEAYNVLKERIGSNNSGKRNALTFYLGSLKLISEPEVYRQYIRYAFEHFPNSLDLFGRKYGIIRDTDGYQEALKFLDSRPEFSEHFFRERLECLEELNRFDEAVCLIKNRKLESGRLRFQLLIEIMCNGNMYGDMVNTIGEEIRRDPSNSTLWAWHAIALHNCDRNKEAFESIERALSQDSIDAISGSIKFSIIYWYRGEIMEKLGNDVGASRSRTLSHFMDPSPEWGKRPLWSYLPLPNSDYEMPGEEANSGSRILLCSTTKEQWKAIQKEGIVPQPNTIFYHKHVGILPKKLTWFEGHPIKIFAKKEECPVVIAIPKKESYHLIETIPGDDFFTEQIIPPEDILGSFNFQEYDAVDDLDEAFTNWIIEMGKVQNDMECE